MKQKTLNFRTHLRGCWTALVTPFKKNGALDEVALKKLIRRQIEARVSGLVLCGSTGEAATLSLDEFLRILSIGVQECQGSLPVMAGIASNDTAKAEHLAQAARKTGVDALLVLSPYYNKPSQEGLYRHFGAVAKAAHLPIVIYNIPGRTAVNVLPETLEKLAKENPNVVGVKESSGNLDQISEIILHLPDSFSVLSGDDNLTLPILSIGGTGAVSVVSNLFPGAAQELCRSFEIGNAEKARHWHSLLFPLVKSLFLETNPVPIKAALKIMGLCEETVRLPLTPLSSTHRPALKKQILLARELFS